MLIKLTPGLSAGAAGTALGATLRRRWKSGVNFTNMFTNKIYMPRPQKRKKTVKLSSVFALLVPANVKASSKMLLKNRPGVDRTSLNYVTS